MNPCKTPAETLIAQFQCHAGKEISTHLKRDIDMRGRRFDERIIDSEIKVKSGDYILHKSTLAQEMNYAASQIGYGLSLTIDGRNAWHNGDREDHYIVGSIEKDAEGVWRLSNQFKIT